MFDVLEKNEKAAEHEVFIYIKIFFFGVLLHVIFEIQNLNNNEKNK